MSKQKLTAFEKQRDVSLAFYARMAARAEARDKHFHFFHETFKRNLKDFWGPHGNIMGLDICKLDEEVVKSGPNESMRDAIVERWGGEPAAKMVEVLIGHGLEPSD